MSPVHNRFSEANEIGGRYQCPLQGELLASAFYKFLAPSIIRLFVNF